MTTYNYILLPTIYYICFFILYHVFNGSKLSLFDCLIGRYMLEVALSISLLKLINA